MFLNGWIFFALVPLYLLYKQHADANRQTKLIFISIVFMILAIARPVVDNTLQEESFDSQDYIIALDISYSMQADDLKPNRYILAKKAIKKLIDLHPKDRFTLFVFTSNPLLISPPTTDTAITLMALDALNPEYVLTKGTNILKLLQSVAKIPLNEKKLIIFSDGGEEHTLTKMLQVLKQNNIIPYIVATATHKGAALKKGGRYIKNIDSSLVISKINPILKDLALGGYGAYYELDNTLNTIDQLSKDITQNTTKKGTIQVKNYYELFYLPLLIALLLYISAVTKIHQLFLLPLILIPHYQADASILDSYYIAKAKESFQNKEYQKAAHYFEKITPSVQSYYNIATSYAKANRCKTALNYYTQIQTRNKKLKQMIFYNMANCAVALKHYQRAKKLYVLALALGKDKDALANLHILQKLHLQNQKNITDMLPQKNPKHKKISSKSLDLQKQKKKNSGGKNNSKQTTNQSSNGVGTKNKKTKTSTKNTQHNSKYQIGYKAYELINKGYTNEHKPW
jgi:Ca-activated chloride channel family protein